MTEIALPVPPQIWTPDYGALGERLRLPRWAKPWERTKEDSLVEAATVVTAGGGGNVSTAGSATLAVTITLPTAGNLLVLCSAAFANISLISGGGVGTWSSVLTLAGDTSHNDEDIRWGIVDGTPSTSITVTYGSSNSSRAVRVIEVAGGQKVTDATTAFANDSKGATDSKLITTVTDGCVIISAIGVAGGTTGVGPTGYTQLPNEASGGNGLYTAYLQQATHGASTMNWSGLGSTTFPALGGIAVKPASSSTPVSNTAGPAVEALQAVAQTA